MGDVLSLGFLLAGLANQAVSCLAAAAYASRFLSRRNLDGGKMVRVLILLASVPKTN